MGFNNGGAAAAAAELRPRPAGAAIAPGHRREHRQEPRRRGRRRGRRLPSRAHALLAPLADYLVVNVSSPNTPGLRGLQELDRLAPLLDAVPRMPRRHARCWSRSRPTSATTRCAHLAALVGATRARGHRRDEHDDLPRRPAQRSAPSSRPREPAGCRGAARRALARGAAPAARRRARRAVHHLGRGSRDRRRRPRAARGRRHPGAGLHGVPLPRPALGAQINRELARSLAGSASPYSG